MNDNKKPHLKWMMGALFFSAPVLAETPQDPAGRIGQDLLHQEQRIKDKAPVQQGPALQKEEEVEPSTEDAGPFFVLSGIRFTRSTHLTREELQGIIQPWLGKEVSYQTLVTAHIFLAKKHTQINVNSPEISYPLSV